MKYEILPEKIKKGPRVMYRIRSLIPILELGINVVDPEQVRMARKFAFPVLKWVDDGQTSLTLNGKNSTMKVEIK